VNNYLPKHCVWITDVESGNKANVNTKALAMWVSKTLTLNSL